MLHLLALKSACLAMADAMTAGKSFFGCGTMIFWLFRFVGSSKLP
jgi:hypothetical protein